MNEGDEEFAIIPKLSYPVPLYPSRIMFPPFALMYVPLPRKMPALEPSAVVPE
jgi:hypothetical protein